MYKSEKEIVIQLMSLYYKQQAFPHLTGELVLLPLSGVEPENLFIHQVHTILLEKMLKLLK